MPLTVLFVCWRRFPLLLRDISMSQGLWCCHCLAVCKRACEKRSSDPNHMHAHGSQHPGHITKHSVVVCLLACLATLLSALLTWPLFDSRCLSLSVSLPLLASPDLLVSLCSSLCLCLSLPLCLTLSPVIMRDILSSFVAPSCH